MWWLRKDPDILGVDGGRLAPCKRTPNCVSSQADPSDRVHYVTPLRRFGDTRAAIAAVRAAVAALPRTRIVREDADYLRAEFRSRWMGFVDDVEFLFVPAEGAIHVRSASRLGRRDFGVNRTRIEAIRGMLANSGN